MIFDENQISVIKASPGALLVTAGPGSGKTAVLTQRVIYLNKAYNIPFDKILVITFTKAAASQMKSRFEKEYEGESKVTFCTFHSLFYSIIRDFKSENFLIISLKEKLNILKMVLMDMNLDISRLDLNEIIDEISKVKNLDLNPENYVSKSIDPDKFPQMFKLYHEETGARNLIDYDDFVIIAGRLFDKNPDFLDKWMDKYSYCLIDEFQDINYKQYEMVKRLFIGKGVFAVGDEDQSIYAFRGSSSDICLMFKKDFAADVLKLETNYRSTKNIVKAGMNLISFNSLRFDKRIVPVKGAKEGEFKVKSFDTYKEEYEVLVKEAKEGLTKGKSVAILLRTNNIQDSLQYCLLKYKVPYITEKTGILLLSVYIIKTDRESFTEVSCMIISRRLISAAIALVGSTVGLVLSAAHTKKDLIDIRHERLEELTRAKEKHMNKLNAGLEEYRNTTGAVLIDVREKEDFDKGHIPGAVYADLRTIRFLHYGLETPLFLYCYRGNRSAMAAGILREAGFQNVKDIGGIDWYSGELEQ